MNYIYKQLATIFLLLICISAACQVNDTVPSEKKNNIINYAMRLVKKSHADTINQQGVLTTKSEAAYQPYEGKIIRHIIIYQYKFGKTFTDTASNITYFGTRLLNSLHNTTKEWAIRDNLFIKENTPVVSYILADNERFLRTLDYIQDARIIIQSKTGSPDSVDIYVITKDLFSINGVLNQASPGKFKATVEDVNLFGAAQSLRATVLIQKDRVPAAGVGLTYSKFNILHTFVDASIGYSTISPDLYNGTTDEHAIVFSLQRNLYSQYSHFAGGLTIGDFKTFNSYKKPENDFYGYHNHYFDIWAGYNLGIKKLALNKIYRDRKFASIRYFKSDFPEIPQQAIDKLIFRFNNRQAILGQLTFFKQELHKTNYLYGFGNTEDVPYGYNVAFTGGWYWQSYLSRPYIGVDANRYVIYSKGHIVQYFLRAGSFFDHGEFQDAGILLGSSAFSKAISFKNLKIRQYASLSYTRLFNRVGLDPLTINSLFGLRYFKADSVQGDQRLSLNTETNTFVNLKIFGFKFSPFALGGIAGISPEKNAINKSAWYYAIGGGVRTRNENLVFRTIEFRFVYFPRTYNGSSQFLATINVNIEFRYNTNYVHEPEIIQYNSDFENNVF